MFSENSLHDHLISDHFFDCSGTLIVIDDYNIFSMKKEAIDFYIQTLKEVGCKRINIYFQVNFDKDADFAQLINRLADAGNIDHNSFHSLYSLLQTNFHYNHINDHTGIEHSFLDSVRKSKWKTNGAVSFVTRMQKENQIEVNLIPFSEIGIKPPFHGRYWLAKSNNCYGHGYIVDASLNTYGHGKIFAQLMDHENFVLITDFFDNQIVKNQLGIYIDLDKLKAFRNFLERFFRYPIPLNR